MCTIYLMHGPKIQACVVLNIFRPIYLHRYTWGVVCANENVEHVSRIPICYIYAYLFIIVLNKYNKVCRMQMNYVNSICCMCDKCDKCKANICRCAFAIMYLHIYFNIFNGPFFVWGNMGGEENKRRRKESETIDSINHMQTLL